MLNAFGGTMDYSFCRQVATSSIDRLSFIIFIIIVINL